MTNPYVEHLTEFIAEQRRKATGSVKIQDSMGLTDEQIGRAHYSDPKVTWKILLKDEMLEVYTIFVQIGYFPSFTELGLRYADPDNEETPTIAEQDEAIEIMRARSKGETNE